MKHSKTILDYLRTPGSVQNEGTFKSRFELELALRTLNKLTPTYGETDPDHAEWTMDVFADNTNELIFSYHPETLRYVIFEELFDAIDSIILTAVQRGRWLEY